MSDSVFTHRPSTPDDHTFIRAVMVRQARENGFFRGVASEVLGPEIRAATASLLRPTSGWTTLVVTPAGEPDEICGFVIYRVGRVIFHAYVKTAYRGLGVWRLMRETIGLAPGDTVGFVLAAPPALFAARKKYRVAHLPFLILEALGAHREAA